MQSVRRNLLANASFAQKEHTQLALGDARHEIALRCARLRAASRALQRQIRAPDFHEITRSDAALRVGRHDLSADARAVRASEIPDRDLVAEDEARVLAR